MSDNKIRIAVIGAGGIANSVHLPSIAEIPECELAAICDIVPGKALKAAEKYNIKQTYTLHQEMLAKEDLDGVFCLVQPDLMYRVVYDCLQAGKNVFMEKPAGISAYQADSLARQSAKCGKTVAVGMNRRHIPLVQYVFKIMKEMTEITQVDGCFIKFSDIAKGWHYADAFACDIVHAVDLVRYFAGSEAVNAATVIGRHNSPVDNAWSSVIRFRNGITGTLRSNYQAAARIHNFEIHGPKASAYINLGFPGTKGCDAIIVHSSGKSMYSQAAVGVGKQQVEKIDGIELCRGSDALYSHYGYLQEDIDFIECLKTGRKPLCSIEDAALSMHLVEMLLAGVINKNDQ